MKRKDGDSKRRSQIAHAADGFSGRHWQGLGEEAVARSVRGNAYHQAGHAVVCCLLYGARVVKSASILPDSEKRGEVIRFSALPIPLTYRSPRDGRREPIPPDALVDAEGVFAYAGIAAEDLLAGRDEPADGGPGGQSAQTRAKETGADDRERLAKLASTLGRERPADRFFEAYWVEARRLLRQNWSSVERVAAALLEHGRLNGDRVDVLVL
jgi:hypothetical protein